MRRTVGPDGTVLCPFRNKPGTETCMACSLFIRFSRTRGGVAVRCRAPAPSRTRRSPGTQLAR